MNLSPLKKERLVQVVEGGSKVFARSGKEGEST